MAGKGGGAWKVAYADFVTAMMAFFLVMWIVAQNKPVREAVAKYFRDPFATSDKAGGSASMGAAKSGGLVPSIGPHKQRPPTETANAEKPPKPAAGGSRRGQSKKSNVLMLRDGKQAHSGTRLVFGEQSAELDDTAKKQLQEIVPLLLGKRNRIEIRGHATRAPLPSDSPLRDTWQLCFARCVAVRDALQELGLEPDRIRLSQAGPNEPDAAPVDAKWQEASSRVEVLVLDDYVDAH